MVDHRFMTWIAAVLLLLCLAVSVKTLAASVQRVASIELVADSALIFQGEVYQSQSFRASNGRIYTYVDFSIVDVLKGRIDSNSLRLRFTGGTDNGERLDVGVAIPRVGEHGIYFVESISSPLLNPLLGWQQGHFTITEDNRVAAGDGSIVVAINAEQSSQAIEISTGVAAGFTTLAARQLFGRERALTPEEFKVGIRGLLDRGRGNHE